MARFRRPRSPVDLARRSAAGLLLLVALGLALRPAPAPARAGSPAAVPVTVAARDLPPGTVLGSGDLAVVRTPAALAPGGTADDATTLVGRVLAGGVRAREPVTDVRLVGTGLTDLLPDGQVAAPVRLADVAVTALVGTGDRVDVLATAPDAGRADVVAAGALVLAAPGPSPPGADDGDPGLLLLAVDPGTAARLAAASTTATLTATLPPP